MVTREQFIKEIYETSTYDNKFPIKIYWNIEGYIFDGNLVNCRTCGHPAKYKYAIYNHLFEPQGSLYYCETCAPKT